MAVMMVCSIFFAARDVSISRLTSIFPPIESAAERMIAGMFPPIRFAAAKTAAKFRISSEPERLAKYLNAVRAEGVFDAVSGILVGKPMNERYYEEYKAVWREAVGNPALPILYNVNIGHAAPRAILPYGAAAKIDADRQEICLI